MDAMESDEILKRQEKEMLQQMLSGNSKDDPSTNRSPFNSSVSSNGYESLNKSAISSNHSSPVVQYPIINYRELLKQFQLFIIQSRARLSGNGPAILQREYRISDLLSWFAESVYLETRRRESTPRHQSFDHFRRFLEDEVGFSIPASVIMPPSQVVQLLVEWKSDETITNVAEGLTGMREREISGGGAFGLSEFAFPEKESDDDNVSRASKMTKFLQGIGYELVLGYVDQNSTDGTKEAADGIFIPNTKLETYRCPQRYCKFTATSIFHLHDHQRQPHVDNNWKCCFCIFTTKRKLQLLRHYRTVHGHISAIVENLSSESLCPTCDRKFYAQVTLDAHLEKGCPMANVHDVLNVSGSDDVLNDHLWPMPQRKRPYWLSLTPGREKVAFEESSKKKLRRRSDFENPSIPRSFNSGTFQRPPAQVELKRTVQANENRMASGRLFTQPATSDLSAKKGEIVVAKNILAPSSSTPTGKGTLQNMFPPLARKLEIHQLIGSVKKKEGQRIEVISPSMKTTDFAAKTSDTVLAKIILTPRSSKSAGKEMVQNRFLLDSSARKCEIRSLIESVVKKNALTESAKKKEDQRIISPLAMTHKPQTSSIQAKPVNGTNVLARKIGQNMGSGADKRLVFVHSGQVVSLKPTAAAKSVQHPMKPTVVSLCRVDTCGQCRKKLPVKEVTLAKNPSPTTVQFGVKPTSISLCRVDKCSTCGSRTQSGTIVKAAATTKPVETKKRQSVASCPKKAKYGTPSGLRHW